MRSTRFIALAAIVFTSHFAITSQCASGADDTILQDFEDDSYGDWVAKGDAFGSQPVNGPLPGQQEVEGQRGRGIANTFIRGDAAIGSLTSPPFKVTHDHIAFLIGGGNLPDLAGAQLLVGDKVIRSSTGANSESLIWTSWDVKDLQGQSVRIRIVDQSTEPFGHTIVDQIVLTDAPPRGAGKPRLEEYRKSADYYRELYRPQFHFTPEMNWMNDPNGLVYYEGEYHLFYQHNPHGNAWGHMSWGHAVSDDLLHWKHLPIALHEEYGVMIFSGCCVVDWNNTSGFGIGDMPPMVAIYTGHGLGKQTQDLAYSTDRGRTWTKYVGNPVIDRNESDFRDPKVFWHQPTKKWVMVVSMATAKFVQFYGSPDLKSWTHLSDFGPAGVEGKPNWECPDLFELPIEGEANKTRWVLEVDMGAGSIAGGSGGEYFVGEFDGESFKCDHDLSKSQWVDFGRDFYAPVSWSDIPESDGRRIWIGWMNNWETNMLPTRPWRSAMSIPRTLTLQRAATGLRMIQKPVREIENLREPLAQLKDLVVDGELDLTKHDIKGDCLEIVAEIELRGSAEVGFHIRKGANETTLVGYDVAKQELFVDRSNSGESEFHAAFAGRHAGSLKHNQGVIRLRMIIDTSSVEVFGGTGETVLTERIFPQPESDNVIAYSQGGAATVKTLNVWKLNRSM